MLYINFPFLVHTHTSDCDPSAESEKIKYIENAAHALCITMFFFE